MSKRFGADVEVEFLQDDMVGFVREPFNQEFDLYGKKLFTDKVRWGEVWLCDQSKRGTKYAGYIQNGALYLDQSAAELNAWVKTRQPRKPSKLRPGRYLVWLDAWLRMGDVIYTSDGPFTILTEDMEESTWVAPPPPKREYWQEIVV